MGKKLKLTIAASIFPPDIGGPATYSRIVAERLLATGYGVGVVAFANSGWRKATEAILPANNFKIVRVSRRWPKGLRHLVYTVRLFRLARHSQAIFAQNATSVGLPAWLVANLLGKPLTVKVVIDSAVEIARASNPADLARYAKGRGGGGRGWLQHFIARRADQVIVPCRYLQKIVAGWGVAPARIVVVYNGVAEPILTLTKTQAQVKLGLHGSVLLCVGRLVPGKGLRMLIKIMPRLLKLVSPHLKLVIVGDGPDAANLRRMIDNLRLKNKVLLVGRKLPDEVMDYYAAADLFVLNTFSEGFSHVLLEALAAGVPVITTAVGGNPEIIANGQNGILLTYNDEAGLVESVKILLQNYGLRQQLSVAGLETARSFSVERMVNETVTALTKLQHGKI